MPHSQFSRETDLIADTDVAGRFHTQLSENWNAPYLPQGGLTTAVATRAMQRHIGHPDQLLRSVNTVFVSQVSPGEVTVNVTILRQGRSMSQVMATLHTSEDTVGLIATGVFGADRPGFAFTDAMMPKTTPPEHCPSFWDTAGDAEGFIPAPLWNQLEGRMIQGHAPWEEHVPTTSEQLYWYRFNEPPAQPDGTLDRLAYPVVCDTMLGSVSERMGTSLPMWLAPSADLSVRILGTTQSEWLLARTRACKAGEGYVSLENELWDPDRNTLIAQANQLAFFSFPHGDVTGAYRAPN